MVGRALALVMLTGCRLWFDPLAPIDATEADSALIDGPPIDAVPLPTTVVDFTDSVLSTNNNSVYTFMGMNVGGAAANRLVVVSVLSNSPIDITSVVVSGTPFTRAVMYDPAGASAVVAIYYAVFPTGATADVVVTVAGGASRCAVGLYRVLFQGTPVPTAVTTATDWLGASQVTVSRPAHGAGIWMAQRINNNSAFSVTLDGAPALADANGTFGAANFNWQYGNTKPTVDGISTYAADFGADRGLVIAAYFR
jgi:hypothetical protein